MTLKAYCVHPGWEEISVSVARRASKITRGTGGAAYALINQELLPLGAVVDLLSVARY